MLAALMQRQSVDDQEQLLRLYWNRAGVKRELVRLKREHYELLEKLEHQESEIMRAQSQLEGLERLLADPLAAANAMVYFQLRHMWRVAGLRLEQFASELKSQREEREKRQLHNAILAKRNRRQQAIAVKLEELLQKRRQTIEDYRSSEQRLAEMNPLIRFFAGPKLRTRVQGMKANREALEDRIREFNDIIARIQGEPLPEPDGLSLESRRLINVAIIALAQHLVLHFEENDLARLSRKASKRSVGDMKFGDRLLCDQMVEHVRERVEDLNLDRQLPDRVKRRADWLANAVQYRHESDATPMRSGLAEITRIGSSDGREKTNHLSPPVSINVLEGDYWELGSKLL